VSKISDRIQKLLEINAPTESHSRFDSEHPFDIFLGIDKQGRKNLSLIMKTRPENVSSSNTISVTYFRRDDGRLLLSFALEDDKLKSIFYKFCEDIIESTRLSKEKDGFAPVIERWNTWIKFFQKTSLPLSENEVLGLVGEVYFLQNVMVKQYGLEVALEAYIGGDKAHKDFRTLDTWYEVKSIHNGVRSVRVSSIEQLDSSSPGKLAIITFDQGTPSTNGNITLNGIITAFRETLDLKTRLLFDEKMRKSSYIADDRYDEYNFVLVQLNQYLVENGFPRLTKDDLPAGVTKASYEIDISAIQPFRIEK
jgi:hypothetical protein